MMGGTKSWPLSDLGSRSSAGQSVGKVDMPHLAEDASRDRAGMPPALSKSATGVPKV